MTLRRLTDDENYEGDSCWSPDGRQIAFVREQMGIGHIWIMDADGSAQRQLTHDRGYDSAPSFSPDGHRIVFVRYGEPQNYGTFSSGSSELFILDVNGASEIRLTNNDKFEWDAKFSADGKRIVYSVSPGEVWAMNSDGGEPTWLAKGFSPCFSPDGKTIGFLADRGGDYNYDVFFLNHVDHQCRRVTYTMGYKSSLDFSADGLSFIFLAEPTARGTGIITFVDLNGMMTTEAGTTY